MCVGLSGQHGLIPPSADRCSTSSCAASLCRVRQRTAASAQPQAPQPQAPCATGPAAGVASGQPASGPLLSAAAHLLSAAAHLLTVAVSVPVLAAAVLAQSLQVQSAPAWVSKLQALKLQAQCGCELCQLLVPAAAAAALHARHGHSAQQRRLWPSPSCCICLCPPAGPFILSLAPSAGSHASSPPTQPAPAQPAPAQPTTSAAAAQGQRHPGAALFQ